MEFPLYFLQFVQFKKKKSYYDILILANQLYPSAHTSCRICVALDSFVRSVASDILHQRVEGCYSVFPEQKCKNKGSPHLLTAKQQTFLRLTSTLRVKPAVRDPEYT